MAGKINDMVKGIKDVEVIKVLKEILAEARGTTTPTQQYDYIREFR